MTRDLLHDDSEWIIVYISRKYMLQRARLMLFLTLVCVVASGSTFFLPQGPLEPTNWQANVLFFGSLACLCAVLALVLFVRSMGHRPTLVVNAKGIYIYHSSFSVAKRVLHWREIAWVGYEIQASAGFIRQSLIINVFQFPDGSARAPITDTPSPTSPYPYTTTVMRVSEEMFDMPVSELAFEIERYIEVHAPSGWHGELSGEQRDHVLTPKPPDSFPAW